MMPWTSLLFGVSLLASNAFAQFRSVDELFELRGQAAMVTDAAYTPAGDTVVSCDVKGMVFAWNPETGETKWNLSEPDANFSRVTISADGRLGAVVGLRFAGVFDVRAGRWIKKFDVPNNGALNAVAISESNLLVALGSSDSHLRILDVASGEVRDFASHDWGIMDVRFMDHDQFLLAGDATTIRVWNLDSHAERRIVDTEAGDVPGVFLLSRMAFSNDGAFVLVSSGNDAMLFNLVAKELVQTFRGHDKEIVSLRITPDLAAVVTSSRDHTTRVWDTETGEQLAMTTALDLSLTTAITVSPRNDQFIMSAAIFDIFGGTLRSKLGIWSLHSQLP